MTDLLLIGHGSRDRAAATEFSALVELLEPRLAGRRIRGGFLELAEPPIDQTVDDLVAAGATDVVAVPYVLFGAGHLKDDGPAVLARARRRHPGVQFRLARDLGTHPAVLDVAEQRARSTIAALPPGTGPTAVVLVGRGSTDPDACAELVKFARLLGDGRGFELVEAAFVAMTAPRSRTPSSGAAGSVPAGSPSSRCSCSPACWWSASPPECRPGPRTTPTSWWVTVRRSAPTPGWPTWSSSGSGSPRSATSG